MRPRAPIHRRVDLADVGAVAAFPASPAARTLTGGVHLVDGGYSVVA
jgi:enoyl-[acyl-carrier protein] reductase I